jgi:hypothetical protein
VDILLAPDVYVNASVAPGTTPAHVVQRVLGHHKGQTKATEWVLARTAAILANIPEFRRDAIDAQIELIRSYVQVLKDTGEYPPDAWEEALVASAKAAGALRVITDHPDLLKRESSDGIEFVSTEAWLLEATTPPPVPDYHKPS